MSLTVHLWGIDCTASMISPQSVALMWLLLKIDADCTLVFSNNTYLSPTNELPLLIEHNSEGAEETNEKLVCGYMDIAKFLLEKEDVAISLEITGILHFLMQDWNYLTLYQLFLDKDNYQEFTNRELGKLFSWPLSLFLPMQLGSKVKTECNEILNIDFLPIDDEDIETYIDNENKLSPNDNLHDTADIQYDIAQSKTFKLQKLTKRKQQEELLKAKHNLQFLTHLNQSIEEWFELTKSLEISNWETSVIECLFYACLYIQLNLPSGELIRQHLGKTFPNWSYQESIDRYMVQFSDDNESKPTGKTRLPHFTEQNNIIMSIYNKSNQLLEQYI